MDPQQLDALIMKIMFSAEVPFAALVSSAEIRALCNSTINVLSAQPVLLDLQPPVIICGDIHGQFSDLMRIFKQLGFPPTKNYLFLGDYVGRGRQSIETAVLLFCYKVKYPENFFLLRGNHECRNMNRVYGFLQDLQNWYPVDWEGLMLLFNQTFAWLPFTALVGGRILCMHGGISHRVQSLQQLRDLHRPTIDFDARNPTVELDLLWADPEQGIRGCVPNNLGASVVFGKDVVDAVCQRLDVDLIARAHQVVQDGAEFFANRRLVTLFSAPHYAAVFNNAGATMLVDENLRCVFAIFKPTEEVPPPRHRRRR